MSFRESPAHINDNVRQWAKLGSLHCTRMNEGWKSVQADKFHLPVEMAVPVTTGPELGVANNAADTLIGPPRGLWFRRRDFLPETSSRRPEASENGSHLSGLERFSELELRLILFEPARPIDDGRSATTSFPATSRPPIGARIAIRRPAISAAQGRPMSINEDDSNRKLLARGPSRIFRDEVRFRTAAVDRPTQFESIGSRNFLFFC
ncbi:unnamed protein product [Nesidiocoris tenuis]|uniref:Uncharacterized protein n=1 Tax=Nesidiocoris tenuis TaxID=355587 RepID=A0A6H5G4X4_9HEMI|nr:unnamed protein product [Nesidiocoris tenuis]